ncbi:hypothetical protein IE077_001593 [Cardiosporidium cionae]|uniref:Uncharacterized protein n=1 Tax=Cardiosporidium cionae TaxID=476202 RepID=A0ABQ7JCP7_9APIC|nr:hypothetical protein IE077_001593 [Cardiosporidium cionae]|eukprot:KAF8821782.1 hypothetical protein IE077_001593 [Cardiosporidium cionae]
MFRLQHSVSLRKHHASVVSLCTVNACCLYVLLLYFPTHVVGGCTSRSVARWQPMKLRKEMSHHTAVGLRWFVGNSICNLFICSPSSTQLSTVTLFGRRVRPPVRSLRPRTESLSDIPNPQYTGQGFRRPVQPGSDFSLLKPVRSKDAYSYYEYDERQHLRAEGFNVSQLEQVQPRCLSTKKKFKKKRPGLEVPCKRETLRTRFYGKPALPATMLPRIETWNKENPNKMISEDEIRCDLLYCFSNGIIARIQENALPYQGEIGPYYNEKDKEEPRFIVQAQGGFIAKSGLRIGDELGILNAKNRKEIFDNHFARPRSFREPLKLPNGRYIP